MTIINILLILLILVILSNSYYNYKVYYSKNSIISTSLSSSSSSKSKLDKKNNINDDEEKSPHNNINKHNYNNLLTDPDKCMVRVAGSRTILPGDYVVHEEYGIGLYLGIRMVDLTPARKIRTWQPVVVVKYQDAEITWFQRVVDKELWLFRQAESGLQELSSILDTKKWKRRKKNAEQNSKNMAINLIKMTTIRNELHRTPSVPNDDKYREFEKRFSWDPTPDQLSCFNAIEDDMVKNTRPMDRLICGDVGFGKTEVAMRAIYRAALSKKQVVLLAPTRILAQQHYRVLCNRMPDVNIQLLRGGGGSDSLKTKDLLKDGTCQVVVGTHAVLGESVKFDNLGLLVIDEEQRFGVAQKEKLKVSAAGTDVLTLSATPIPRTLQMALSGLRDLSQMTSPPKGRLEVKVKVLKLDKLLMKTAIEAEISRGGQAFVVVPLVQQVEPTRDLLEEILPDVECIEAHGEHSDLERRIDEFTLGKAKVLIATTVIENGIDMPNVNTIIVLNAQRFGMSTLYQLRGRVGRSTRQAYAYFMTNTTNSLTVDAENRLTHLETFTALGSGYDLARRDMDMRGYGTIFGSDQSGTKDVGMDLQASIMQRELVKLKKEFIITVPDSRIGLDTSIELYAKSLFGPLPSSSNLADVSRYEAELAKAIIDNIKDTKNDKVIKSDWLRSFLSAGTTNAIFSLSKEWQKILGQLPLALEDLLKRAHSRVSLRRISVTEALRIDNDVILSCTSIDEKKWEQLKPFIPKDLLSRIEFEEIYDIDRNNSGNSNDDKMLEYLPVSQIKIKNLYKGDDDNTIPSDLLRFSIPLAAAADKQISDAVSQCNPTTKSDSSED